MHHSRRLLIATCFALGLAGPALAQERGTKDEAKALADAAFDHIKKVGAERAFKDFTTDKANWTRKDLYVAATDYKGISLAHGANERLVGKELLNIKDAHGVPFIARMIEVSKAPGGTGWVDYDWPHPQTKRIEGKTSYVRQLPSGDGFLNVGFYR